MTNPVPTHAPKTDTPATRPTPPNPVRMGRRSVTVAYGVMQTTKYVDSAEAYITHLESTLAAERASRLQAEEARCENCRCKCSCVYCLEKKHAECWKSCGAKPSVSPEQEKP